MEFISPGGTPGEVLSFLTPLGSPRGALNAVVFILLPYTPKGNLVKEGLEEILPLNNT